MKILVLGACGLVGSKVVGNLRQLGYPVVAGSPQIGADIYTGTGLTTALRGVEVVIDTRPTPSLETEPARDCFETAGRHLAAALAVAGVEHHILLSALGSARMQTSGYYRAKVLQEQLVQAGSTPHSIVRAAPLYECLSRLAHSAQPAHALHMPLAQVQAMAAADIAMVLADAALARPLGGSMDAAGPQRMGMAEWMQQYLHLRGDLRAVVPDADARYQGVRLDDSCLVPAGPARLGSTSLAAWVCKSQAL